MRVFVAGAAGVIGASLVRRLVAAGHEVTGTTRKQERLAEIEAAGARGVLVDVFDADRLRNAVAEDLPEAVIDQLTSLPTHFNPRRLDYGPTNRVRLEGSRNLLAAAQAAQARRFISQSIAFLYAPEGEPVKDEEGPPFTDAPGQFGGAVEALLTHEREALESDGLETLVLRYGWFYGPGTYFAGDGSVAQRVRRRLFPIVGSGAGVTSFIHVDDAASATMAALEAGAPGIYNVVDDEPATYSEWLPVYAEALGAKPPRRIPVWLARLLAGPTAGVLTSLRGATNAKAKAELGWQPAHPNWRDGFREALG